MSTSDDNNSKTQSIGIGVKVKLIESIGREYVHPNDIILVGSVGVIREIDGEVFLVDFGSAEGYKIGRTHWLYNHEFDIK